MIKNTLCVLCKSIITSKEENLVSYIDTLDSLAIKKFPLAIGPFCFGSVWKKDSDKIETLKVKLSVTNPKGQATEIFTSEELEVKHYTHRLNVSMNQLKFESPGQYKFIVEFNQNNSGFQYAGEAILKVIQADNSNTAPDK